MGFFILDLLLQQKVLLISDIGLALVREKYLNSVYGQCPRILCDKQMLLPIGLSEELKYSRVKV
jgi:casein kinase II subunit beta